ncbi:hypothetical protein RND71_042110 [Anisodus tanguticus]|uniref:Uncharacterized protein n=1 Tax=Anisodus tanguticus TaxID=243964 RepID=A0AAE1QRY3_9SOLA|nr:hypothetical protein RND71_042110 [Anisodus tanguticus]
MPDFGNLLDPPSNLEISSESNTQMQTLNSDQDSHMGIPILLKEDNLEKKEGELKLENNGFGELETKENELNVENNGCCEVEMKEEELILEKNGCIELEMKEDELILENNGCVELEMKVNESNVETNDCGEFEKKDDELFLENNGCSELDLKKNGYIELEKKDEELILENNGCVELEQKEELNLENSGYVELEKKENELILENNGCVELEMKEDELILENNGCVELEMKEDELILENNGCVELEMKEDELILENNGCVELNLEKNGCGELEKKDEELILENNGCGELNLENNGCGELERKEDELILENNGCGELNLENNGCGVLEMKEDELILENNGCGELEIRGLRPSFGGLVAKKSLGEFVQDWVDRKVNAGVDKRNCVLPLLIHAPKLVECSVCQRLIFPGEEVECSVRDCTGLFHLTCAKERLGLSSPKTFKCPQHVCYVCNKKIHLWRCIRCTLASHDKCAAFPEHVVHLNDQPGRVICWKHPSDWRLEKEIFNNLPLPYVEEEFKIDINWKDMIDNRSEPPPYVHIKRRFSASDLHILLVSISVEMQTANAPITASYSDIQQNIRLASVEVVEYLHALLRLILFCVALQTELCGWGVVAAESINKGDFIIEYIGEGSSAWNVQGEANDFSASYFGCRNVTLLHVEGETRVGVFAAQSIEVGEPLTYDYRFVQFGPEVKCHCGASNCQGYLGSKKKIISKLDICWGSKRKRTSTSCLAIIKVNSC